MTSHKQAASCRVLRTQGFTNFTFEQSQTSYWSDKGMILAIRDQCGDDLLLQIDL